MILHDSSPMRTHRPFRYLCVPVLFASLSCSAPQDARAEPAAAKPVVGEKSVRPGINKSFLSPDLDIAKSKKRFEVESREIFAHRHRITKALDLKPGMAAADVGAGTGLFMSLFAKSVGENGKLYCVDIAPNFVVHLRKLAKQKKLTQIETVHCTGTSSKLPPASIDLAFVCDTYHHFEFPKSTLSSLRSAIRPGGQLVIVDFEKIPGVSRKFIMNHVRCGKKTVIEEIEAAGFRYIDELDVKGLKENYLIRFRRD